MNRNLPHVDTLILGGTTAGVAAALRLKESGHSVAILTHRTYLGEDRCDGLQLAVPPDTDLSHPLLHRLYREAVQQGGTVRPMHLKRELDRICGEADIPVLFSIFVSDIQSTENGISVQVRSRSSSFEIESRFLLDASLRGETLRFLGVPLSSPSPTVEVTRRVIGGTADTESEWTSEQSVSFSAEEETRSEPLWEHHHQARLPDGSWGAWMEVEQHTRLMAYRSGQSMSADGIEAQTGERIVPEDSSSPVADSHESLTPEAVSCCGGRVWVAGPLAHVGPTLQNSIRTPEGTVRFAECVADLLIKTSPKDSPFSAVGSEFTVDVLVVGGGTGGAPAAIGAARNGANTLVVEMCSGLGGVGTLGLIGKYWYGNRVGFTAEVDAGAKDLTDREMEDGAWDIEAKMQWYHRSITEAGGKIWYKTGLLEVLHEEGKVTGAVLGTPQGAVTVHATCVVDATGAAMVAEAAGAETVAIGQDNLALQGTGLPGRDPGVGYRNTDYDFIDDSNDEDLSSAHITARERFKDAFDAGQLIDSRERRRIVGDVEVSPMDIRLRRVFPDSITLARSNFDTHGYTVHPLFMIVPPDHDPREGFIPLRALLAKGVEGLITTGLGISAHRDAMPVIRMQADVQNQGYAAGSIAAMAAEKTAGRVRDLEIQDIQAHLVEVGILDPELQGAADSFPLPTQQLEQALQESVKDPNLLDQVFTLEASDRNARLQKAYREAETEEARKHFAFVLGILGDATGADLLAKVVKETDWDEGWDYTGMGQFGASMSHLDARIIALGRCGASQHAEVLKRKAETLPPNAAFSHYRALAESFQTLGQPGGVAALSNLVQRDGISGHHLHQVEDRMNTITSDSTETAFRNRSLIELHLATALFRLDPSALLAKQILEAYAKDLRHVFAAHAKRILQENP